MAHTSKADVICALESLGLEVWVKVQDKVPIPNERMKPAGPFVLLYRHQRLHKRRATEGRA